MCSEFLRRARKERDLIVAPGVPVAQILQRSRALSVRARVRAISVGAALCAATIGAATAYAPSISKGIHFWLEGNRVSAVVDSGADFRQPMASDLKKIVSSATFSVTLPVGLPKGLQLDQIMYAPADHPDSITLTYRNYHSGRRLGISLIGPAAILASATPKASDIPQRTSYRWSSGNETVVMPRSALSPEEAANVRDAMAVVGAHESQAAAESQLPRVEALHGTAAFLARARRYAPTTARSVLLGPWQLREIARLAADGKPLRDDRLVYLTHIPQIDGRPNFARAIVRWPYIVAVSAPGVRAVWSVMRYKRMSHACDCAILVSAHASKYLMWVIPRKPSSPVLRYSVDASAFAVRQL